MSLAKGDRVTACRLALYVIFFCLFALHNAFGDGIHAWLEGKLIEGMFLAAVPLGFQVEVVGVEQFVPLDPFVLAEGVVAQLLVDLLADEIDLWVKVALLQFLLLLLPHFPPDGRHLLLRPPLPPLDDVLFAVFAADESTDCVDTWLVLLIVACLVLPVSCLRLRRMALPPYRPPLVA